VHLAVLDALAAEDLGAVRVLLREHFSVACDPWSTAGPPAAGAGASGP
jgi:hypothetical protein